MMKPTMDTTIKPTMDTTMKPTYEDLIKALEMAHYELLTLNPP